MDHIEPAHGHVQFMGETILVSFTQIIATLDVPGGLDYLQHRFLKT